MDNLALRNYPILEHLTANQMTKRIYAMIPGISSSHSAQVLFDLNFNFFVYRSLQISLPSLMLHEQLCRKENFLREKTLLSQTRETTGLLLLPQVIDVERLNHERVEIESIFYSWLSHDHHFAIAGLNPQSHQYTISSGRSLLILPLSKHQFIRDIDLSRLYCRDIDFGENRLGMSAYEGLQDYVLSFILLDNFQAVYDEVLLSSCLKREEVNYLNNKIELIHE